jgi:hypothetical protein
MTIRERSTFRTAAIIKGMLRRGDEPSEIARRLQMSLSRVTDVARGKTFTGVRAVRASRLSSLIPALTMKHAPAEADGAAIYALEEARNTIDTALSLLRRDAA